MDYWFLGKETVISEKYEHEKIDDTDWPELEDPDRIMRKELAKEKSRRSKVFFMCRGIVEEIANSIGAKSEASKIVDMILNRSVLRIRKSEVWSLLEDDNDLQTVILKKIRGMKGIEKRTRG